MRLKTRMRGTTVVAKTSSQFSLAKTLSMRASHQTVPTSAVDADDWPREARRKRLSTNEAAVLLAEGGEGPRERLWAAILEDDGDEDEAGGPPPRKKASSAWISPDDTWSHASARTSG